MSATKIKDIVLPALAKFWAKIEVQINELKDNITVLQTKMQSFENTKSEIVGSGLGTALSLTASTTWANIVSKIKAIVNRGAWTGSISTSGGSVSVPVGYHNGSGKVTGPTLAALVGTNVNLANAANLLSGYTAYGKNGTKYTGTNKGYDAGVTAGKTPISGTITPTSTSATWTRVHDGGSNSYQMINLNLGFAPNYLVVLNDTTSNSQYLRSIAVYVRSLGYIFWADCDSGGGGCCFKAKKATASSMQMPIKRGSVETKYYAW